MMRNKPLVIGRWSSDQKAVAIGRESALISIEIGRESRKKPVEIGRGWLFCHTKTGRYRSHVGQKAVEIGRGSPLIHRGHSRKTVEIGRGSHEKR